MARIWSPSAVITTQTRRGRTAASDWRWPPQTGTLSTMSKPRTTMSTAATPSGANYVGDDMERGSSLTSLVVQKTDDVLGREGASEQEPLHDVAVELRE